MFSLSNLLPGFRDLRAPLASGYGWLVFSVALGLYEGWTLKGVVSRVSGLWKLDSTLSHAVLAALISIIAYVIGIVSCALLVPLARLLVRALTLALLVIYLILTFYMLLWERSPERLRRWHDAGGEFLANGVAPSGRRIERMEALALSYIEDSFLASESVRADMFDRLNDDAVIKTYVSQLLHDNVGFMFSLGDEVYSPKRVQSEFPENPDLLREGILTSARNDAIRFLKVRRSLIYALINVRAHADDLVGELKTAPSRLLGNSAAFDRWDRLTAEAEFRHGLAVPLLAAAVGAPILTSLPWLAWCPTIALGVVLIVEGNRKETEAEQQLTEFMRAKIVTPPNLGVPESAQFYWRAWDQRKKEVEAGAPSA